MIIPKFVPLMAGAAALVSATSGFAQGFDGTRIKGSLWGAADGPGFAVAVGPGGAVARKSGDGAWRGRKLKGGGLLLAVAIGADGAVVAVGGRGGFTDGRALVLRSTDQGRTFQAAPGVPGGTLYEVKFPAPGIGFAAGVGGTLLKTADGGVTWKVLKTGTKEKLWAVHFLDARTGFIGGGDTPWQNDGKRSGVIRRTADGGKTWRTVYQGKNRISDFSFVDARTGYAGGVGGELLRTVDGGVTWRTVGRTPLKAIVNAVTFTTEKCGLIVGAGGTAYVTRDGGETWPTRIPVTKGSFLEDLAAASGGGFWVAGGDGTIGRIRPGAGC